MLSSAREDRDPMSEFDPRIGLCSRDGHMQLKVPQAVPTLTLRETPRRSIDRTMQYALGTFSARL